MIQVGTRVSVVDNSGALEAMIIGITKGVSRDRIGIGDVVALAIKKARPASENAVGVAKGKVVHGVVIRIRGTTRKKNGFYVKFFENAVVLLKEDLKTMRGSVVLGATISELRDWGFREICKLAKRVI